jgi:glycosyltransferase involved in cell wall biosynthesis
VQVTYVARSFLDYRIPVLEAMHRKLHGRFRFIYSADYVPARCHERLRTRLGEGAVGLRGEWRIGPNETAGFANKSLRVVYQPGLWAAIRESRPDVLVGDGFFQWTGFALAYRIRRPVGLVVCYERTFHTERSAQRLRTAYRRRVMRWVDAMSCNGSLCVQYSVHLGMDPARITVGQMAADSHRLAMLSAAAVEHSRARLRAAWGSPEIVFVSVGRLNDRKGTAELLNGWNKLQARLPGQARLVIVGDGPERTALGNRVNVDRIPGVVFAGHVDYDGIADYYAAADALVMPTLEDNWSLVVPEAMACGLPVLCSIYNGCYPELVRDDRNGWRFDPLDTDGTYRALWRCVEAKGRLAAMGEESRRLVEAYTPERAADAIIEACRMAQAHVRRGS